jgi:hypothetical protein
MFGRRPYLRPVLISIFDPTAVIFAGVFLGVSAYVAVEAFGGKLN